RDSHDFRKLPTAPHLTVISEIAEISSGRTTMLRSHSAVRFTLLVCAIAPSYAQLSSTNPGLKDWFSQASWVSDIAGVQGTAGFNSNNIPALNAFLDPGITGYALADVK